MFMDRLGYVREPEETSLHTQDRWDPIEWGAKRGRRRAGMNALGVRECRAEPVEVRPRCLEQRVQFQTAPIGLNGLRHLSSRFIDDAEQVMKARLARFELDGTLEMRRGVIEPILLIGDQTEIIMGLEGEGIVVQRLLEGFLGTVGLSHAHIDSSDVIMGIRVIGFERDGSCERPKGLLELSLSVIHGSQVVVGSGTGGGQCQSHAIDGDGFVERAEFVIAFAEVDVGSNIGRILLYGIGPEGHGTLPNGIARRSGDGVREDHAETHDQAERGRRPAFELTPGEERSAATVQRRHYDEPHADTGQIESVFHHQIAQWNNARTRQQGDEKPEDAERDQWSVFAQAPSEPHAS